MTILEPHTKYPHPFFLVAVIICLLLASGVSCVAMKNSTVPPSSTPNIYPTAPAITPLPAAPEPDWVTILYPKPGKAILLKDYNADSHETSSGSLPAPNVPSAICIEIWAGNLIETGDDWEVDDVIKRTKITVDGVTRTQTGGSYDGIVLHTLVDADRNEIGRVGGPYTFCVSAPLGPGFHRADIQFERSSGATEPYSWTFEIFEYTIPTPTPLPVPVAIDRNGEFPAFIRAVYPRPGQIVSQQQYFQIAENEIEIWDSLLTQDQINQRFLGELNSQQAVCFAFRVDELLRLGALPENSRDWPDRIYIQVDGTQPDQWLYPSSQFRDSSGLISAHCIPVEFGTGQHVVSIYVKPFDKDITIYSWSFELEK